MREPFLIAFISMVFWGAMNWRTSRLPSAGWLTGGIVGLVLFSPGVAAVTIIAIAVLVWVRSRNLKTIRWWWYAGVAAIIPLTILLLSLSVEGSLNQGGGITTLFDWFGFSMKWDIYLLERASGWIQNVFELLPPVLHVPFVIGYGMAQPLLPAEIADPAVWPMKVLGILRGLGWYAMAPFLVYSLRPILKTEGKQERLAWLWLWIITWIWIILSAARAGGDQWDNPRYRSILVLFQALLLAMAIAWQRVTHDPWLGRVLAIEGVFLLFFGYWYAARYAHWNGGQVHVFVIIGTVFVLSCGILVGGWLMDRMEKRSLKK